MSSQIDAICLIFLLLVAANIIGVLGYVVRIALRTRRDRRNTAAIAKTIGDYFRKSGVGVTVDCIRVPRCRHFTVAIESEPMKRFRAICSFLRRMSAATSGDNSIACPADW
jgi:hypothetical protein